MCSVYHAVTLVKFHNILCQQMNLFWHNIYEDLLLLK